MSAQRAAIAAQKIATRGEMSGIRLLHRAPQLGRQRGNLDRSPFAEGDHSSVDIIAKRAVEYVPPNENSDTRLPAITTGKRTVRSPRLGADAAWTWIRDWARWGLPHDDRQIQGAIRLAHFRAAKGFTPGAGNRAPAQRPHRHSQFGLGPRQVT